jgi:UDP:flavonoid glycosyltransferase YjiC (YdhE family)
LTYKILLATFGSLGDLHPFMAVGLALRAAGCRVVLASAEEYRDKVGPAGLEFTPMRPSFAAIEADLGMSRAELTRAMTARNDFLFRRVALPYLREATADMVEATAGCDLVLTSGLAFGACLAAEKRGIPWIGIVLQPMLFLSAHDPPVLPKAEWLSSLMRAAGPAASRPLLGLVRGAINTLFGPYRRLRRELGLRPVNVDPLFDGQFRSLGAIGLYSQALGGVQPDHPRPCAIVGFAPYDSEDGRSSALDPALEAFLVAGSPPLVFTLGSTMVNDPGAFYEESVAAARRLGMRAVLLVGDAAPGSTASLRAADVFVGAYAPHSPLFARAAAVVHHGGIGTFAQGLRAGKPQLIVPFFADQLDNAARAVRLGVAGELRPSRYRAADAAAALGALLRDPAVKLRADAVRATVVAEFGAAQAAAVALDRLRGRPQL